ncbi:MAG TPA: hypothetical protein VMN77_06520 [Nitrospiria bacterium]|jgi:hypothetical protein|nr:hypothetical protein [Nitrospiria bacterium]
MVTKEPNRKELKLRSNLKNVKVVEPNVGKSIVRRIREVIPLLELREISPEQISFDVADQVYFLGLDSLLDKRSVPIPVSLRVFGFKNATPVAFFDVVEYRKTVGLGERPRTISREGDENEIGSHGFVSGEGVAAEKEEPRVRQMAISKIYMDVYLRARKIALAAVEKAGKGSHLRLLRVPALNFEAMWINAEDQRNDILVPLRNVGQLSIFKTVPLEEALKALRKAARLLEHMDESMGG